MKISLLPSILIRIIFEHSDPIEEQNPLSWTIPASLSENPTPAQNILEPRETASWTFPVGNSIANAVFTIGDVVDVKWTTDFDEYEIYLWQQDLVEQFATADQDPIYTKSSEDEEKGGFNWTASTEIFSLSDSNVFFFSLGQNATLTGVFTDHYFNLTDGTTTSTKSTSSTTSKKTTPSTTSTTTSASTTVTSGSTTPTTTSSVAGLGAIASPTTTTLSSTHGSSSSSSSSSSGTKLGIGLGLGLGIPIILLLAALVYLKFRSTTPGKGRQSLPSPSVSENTAQQQAYLMQEPHSGHETNRMNPDDPTSYYNKDWRAELHGNPMVPELPASRIRTELP